MFFFASSFVLSFVIAAGGGWWKEARMPQDEIVSSTRRPPLIPVVFGRRKRYKKYSLPSVGLEKLFYCFPRRSVAQTLSLSVSQSQSPDSFKANITSVLPAHTMAHCPPDSLSEHQKILSVSLPNFCFNFVLLFLFFLLQFN